MTSTPPTPGDEMRKAADRLRSMAKFAVPFRNALADWLEETARQFDGPECDSPDGVCNGCERREDFNDALRVARLLLERHRPIGRFLTAANAERSREAAEHNVAIANRIISEGPEADWPPAYMAVARARSEYPDDSWAEIGKRLGMSKDTVAGTFQRVCNRSARRVSLAQNGPAPLP